jgi:hypothetical protein
MLSADRQLLERHVGVLTKDVPLPGHQVGHRADWILCPGTPPAARLLDRVRPVAKSARGPTLRGKGEAKRLRPGQHHVRESEHVRGPLQQPIGYRPAAHGVPSRPHRRRARALTGPTDRPLSQAGTLEARIPRPNEGHLGRRLTTHIDAAHLSARHSS